MRLFVFLSKVLSHVTGWMESLVSQAHQVTHNVHGSSTLSSKEKQNILLRNSCEPSSTKCVVGGKENVMVYADIHKTSSQLVNGRYISLTFEQSTEPCCGVNGMLDSMSQPGCTLSSKEYQTMYLSRTCLPCSTKWVAGWL